VVCGPEHGNLLAFKEAYGLFACDRLLDQAPLSNRVEPDYAGIPMTKLAALSVGATILSLFANAQSDTSMAMKHHHHEDSQNGEKLGRVSFPTSCTARSRPAMERGVALLHSFGYTEAQRQFEAIAKDDPSCAMAHWGIAMTQFHELWDNPDPAALRRGAREMAMARKLARKRVTPREHAYIDALSAFYQPGHASHQQRADAYQAKMDELHRNFPDDVEGAAFDALSMLAAVSPHDTSLDKQRQALKILVPLFAANPEHPGLAHYIIHTCDTPALAPEGLGAAREYAKIAASSPHALHMPSHIFARLGMWQESIQSNLASVTASEKAEAAGQPGSAHQMHAEEFLIYAYLQVGEDEKARDSTFNMRSISDHMRSMPGMDDMKGVGTWFDNEVRTIYAAEMHDWKALAAGTPAPESRDWDKTFIDWGKGIAAGHLHDAKLAEAALASYNERFEVIKKSRGTAYDRSFDVKQSELVGWKEYAEDHPDAAVEAMRKAADEQDKLGQREVDIPAREMLGDLLMLENKPEEALVEYHTALKLSPNRLNGLLSAGQAAEQAKHTDEAMNYYRLAAQQTDSGKHSQRNDLARAVKATLVARR
jgi:tetratricopeptide (TPR) repeat protein